MRLLNDILYIEYRELLDCGISDNTLKSAKIRQSSSWVFVNDPLDNRRLLIEFEKLGNSYQDKIKARFGNPYHYVARQPIKAMVSWDTNAEKFYIDYRYNENKTLPLEHVNKYTKAASWLNMLKEATDDKKTLKKLLNLSIDDFYAHAIELIKVEQVDLPTSYRRLLAARKKYDEEGYGALIDWRFGNSLAAKINDEKSEGVLLEMIQHQNQYDDVFIAQQYNIWAKKNGYKNIDPATVGNHRRKNDHLIIMNREGNAAFVEKYQKQVKGFRPSAPLYLVESDDNHLDLYFIDLDDDSPSKYYHKYKAIVVVDSFNDYVLGYAYSQNLTHDLVRAAYANAMYHIRQYTGAWHLPHEVKTDKWAIKELRPFYESIGKYVPASHGNKQRGYIEQFFGSPHWKRCIKAGANNYSGNNITAKGRGVNQEVLNQNKKDWPMIGSESVAQVEQFFHRLRFMPQSNGISKHEQWLEAWNKLPGERKRQISDEQFLLKFGIEHNHLGQGRQITNRGFEPQINGVKYSYDVEEYNLDHIGKSVSMLYDPIDMSRVLLTDFDKVRIIARDARIQPRALADAHVDSRTFLNSILKEKKDIVEGIDKINSKRKGVVASSYVDAESLLQAGIIVKEIKQDAEQRVLGAMIANKSNEDFNVFDQI